MTARTAGRMGPGAARRAAAAVAGVAAAAAVLGLGVALGGRAQADAPAPRAARGLPQRLVEGSGEVPLGDSMSIWGRPAQLSLFFTPDSPDTVVATYLEAWKAAGFQAQARRIDRVWNASFVEPATGLLRSVTVLRQGDDTLVVPAVVDVRRPPDPTPRDAPVPVPENATAFMAHSADDTTSVTWMANYLVPLAPETAIRFYQVEMGREGYREDEGLPSAQKAATVRFSRGVESVSVLATATEERREDGKKASMVMVTHTRTLREAAP